MSAIRLWAVHPTLRATDIRKLAEWYRDFLGFEIRLLWGDPVTHGVIRRDEVRLGIAVRDANFGPVSAYLMLDGVDQLYAEFLARNVTPNRPPEVTDYRMKDFDLTDPEGNRLCFGEPIETAEPGSTDRGR
ncbi:MAG: glyoxalase superfamily protein [Acidobacteriaceae bacterium]